MPSSLPPQPRQALAFSLACSALIALLVLFGRGPLAKSLAEADPEETPSVPGSSELRPQRLESSTAPSNAGANHPAAPPIKGERSLWTALDAARRSITPLSAEEKALPVNEGVSHFAWNPDQGINARFLDRGVKFASSKQRSWQFTLGYAGAEPVSSLNVNGTRAEYRYQDGVTEWFENRSDGIEHGLTLDERPDGFRGRDEIRLTVNLIGVEACVEDGSGDLILQSPDGTASLRYSGLKAFDANGKTLVASMAPAREGIAFTVNDLGAAYPIVIDPLLTVFEQEIGPLHAGKGASWNEFGTSIAVDGDTAVVGVPSDRLQAGQPDGSAYVFTKSNGIWTQTAYLTSAEDTTGFGGFGSSVAIEGNTVVVGAPHSGANGEWDVGSAHIFTRVNEIWTRSATLVAHDPREEARFGFAVALSGNRVLIGAPGGESRSVGTPAIRGGAYIFNRVPDGWEFAAKLLPADGKDDDLFGESVALEGDHAFVGAPDHDGTSTHHEGIVHVFTGFGGTWNPGTTLRVAGDFYYANFGVSLAADGDTLIVGARGDLNYENSVDEVGRAYVFIGNGASWWLQAKLASSDIADAGFGTSVAIAGDTVAIGAPSKSPAEPYPRGSAHIFTRSAGIWTERTRFDSDFNQDGGHFGASVALGGGTLLIGAPREHTSAQNFSGRAHAYTGSEANWVAAGKLLGSDGGDDFQFGTSVALDQNRALVGAPFDDTALGTDSGCAYLFRKQAGTWIFETRLGAGVTIQDQIGLSVALDGDRALVGAVDFACVFIRTGEAWTLEDTLIPQGITSGFMGTSVALDGNLAIIGAPSINPFDDFLGRAWVFSRLGSDWSQQAELLAAGTAGGDYFGASVAVEGTTVVVGRPGKAAGSVHVFTPINGVWAERAKLVASDGANGDAFGTSVDLMGDSALIGAPGDDLTGAFDAGSAYVFTKSPTTWTQKTKLRSPAAVESASFGAAVALFGDEALVGAPAYADTLFATPVGRGSAHLFSREKEIWSYRAGFVGGSDGGDFADGFGRSVAIGGGCALVGASHKDFTALPHGNRASDQGSVHIYQVESQESVFIAIYDGDANGQLSPTEWASIPAVVPKKETAFPLLDTDLSGQLSHDEILAGRSNKRVAKTLGIWLQRTSAFVELDADGDELLTRQEIAPMWKPGTPLKIIDAFWTRLGGGSGMRLPAWIKAKVIPSIPAYQLAKLTREQRLDAAENIDGNGDERITRVEFAALFKSGTSAKAIDAAWRAATATPKKGTAPESISLIGFVESPKLPKLPL